jgi:hypothetical protein
LPCEPSQFVQSASLLKFCEVYFDQPPLAQSLFSVGSSPVVEGLAEGMLVPGVLGAAVLGMLGEVAAPGVVGLVSPGIVDGPPGLIDGLGDDPGVLVCANTGATLSTSASTTVNTTCQDFMWAPPDGDRSAREVAMQMPPTTARRDQEGFFEFYARAILPALKSRATRAA